MDPALRSLAQIAHCCRQLTSLTRDETYINVKCTVVCGVFGATKTPCRRVIVVTVVSMLRGDGGGVANIIYRALASLPKRIEGKSCVCCVCEFVVSAAVL